MIWGIICKAIGWMNVVLGIVVLLAAAFFAVIGDVFFALTVLLVPCAVCLILSGLVGVFVRSRWLVFALAVWIPVAYFGSESSFDLNPSSQPLRLIRDLANVAHVMALLTVAAVLPVRAADGRKPV